MAVAGRHDPYRGFNFVVEVEGIVVGGFSDASGLQVEIEVYSFREGGLNEYMHQLPGPAKYPTNIVLKRGLTKDASLYGWHREFVNGKVCRKNGSIILRDEKGKEVWRWNFLDAFPVKWSGPEMKAMSGEVAVESLELAHAGLVKG